MLNTTWSGGHEVLCKCVLCFYNTQIFMNATGAFRFKLPFFKLWLAAVTVANRTAAIKPFLFLADNIEKRHFTAILSIKHTDFI